MKTYYFLFFVCLGLSTFAQKDSLKIGDSYAEDQIYLSISYAQFFDQPALITKSAFSYSLSAGFIKDIILNKKGNISFAAGIGYGFSFFNHELRVEETNNTILFSSDNSISNNKFKAHNLELPIEFRWRTSSANKYNFWRVYGGVKFLYNTSHNFKFNDINGNQLHYSNISNYNKLQYGLTLSAGYDEFNLHVFYGLTPIFKNSNLNDEMINTKILNFGFIFYIL